MNSAIRKIAWLLFLAVALLTQTVVFAQTPAQKAVPARTIFPYSVDDDTRADANVLDMFVTNHGTIARDVIGGGPGGLFFPKGSERTVVFSAGLSIGAFVGGELRVATAIYQDEFGPGIMIGSNPADPEDSRFRVYKITTGDGPGTPDWDAWPFADGAPDDGAGNPLLLGDQTLWAVFNDADPALHTSNVGSTNPLGLEVQLTVFAYRWPDALGKTIYVKYRIINKGGNTLEDTYFMFWSDPDLGDARDDFIGYDAASGLGYCYNSNNQDAMYPAAPPAVGYLQLQGPEADGGGRLGVTAFGSYTNGTDPGNVGELYNVMQGLNRDGSEIIDPSTGLPTTYMFSGDPVIGSGWLDDFVADKRCALNAGPFTMAPSDTQEVIYAILVGQGADRLNSIEALRAMVSELENTYNSGFPVPDPPVSDAAAVTIDQPPNESSFQTLNPSATVAHLGWGTATFNAYYSITLGGAPEYQSTRNVSGLAAGQTMQLEFDPWLPSAPGIYDVMLLASSAGDADISNDTLRAQIEILQPAPPVDLHLIAHTASTASMAWSPPPDASDIAGYNIFRSSTSGGPYTKLNGALLTETTFGDTGLPPETVYYVVTLELTNGLVSAYSSELPVYTQTSVAGSGILVVNGVAWDYGQQIIDFYNTQMAGTLPFDFWDLFTGNPVGFTPLGEGEAPPPELFFGYKTVIWIGNNYGDLDFWVASLPALEQYMLSGGNLLFATRTADTFFDQVLRTFYAHTESWMDGFVIGEANPLLATVPELVDMPAGNGATESISASMFQESSGPLPDNLAAFTTIFDWDDLGGTIWKAGFRSELASGGQFVFITGRPYRFDNAASQANYDSILVNWFGHPLPEYQVHAWLDCPPAYFQGCSVTAPVLIDVSGTDPPELLGAYNATLNWDPGMLEYTGYSGGDPPFDAPIVNEDNVGGGELRFTQFSTGGASGNITIINVQFNVIGDPGSGGLLDLEFSEIIAAGTFHDLLPLAQVQDCGFGIESGCLYGDVTLDDAASVFDALIISSYAVGLEIPAEYLEKIEQGCGDVTLEGQTTVFDALVIASYSVGLPVEPYPVGELFCP